MNEKFTIVWQIITLGGVLFSGIYILIDLLVEFIKDRNYKKIKKMAISWKKGNNEPVSHLEDLIHEVVEDTSEYFIQVNEQRLNGKINSILVTINLDERKENENNGR